MRRSTFLPLQDADPTPPFGGFGLRGCVQQMKELSKREFTELLESAEDEQLEFMAEAIVRTQKKRHGWRRWIQPDRIWLVLLTALWIYPWVVGISTDGNLALMDPHSDLLFNLLGVDQELFWAGIADSEPNTSASEGIGSFLLLFFGLFIVWIIFFVWVPVQWFCLALRMFFQSYRITIHARER